jgi:hypothetical protein
MFEYLEAPSEALDCPICRSTLQDPVEITSCQHIFCSRCLAKWNYAACPIDRAKLDQAGVRRASALVRSLLDDARVQCGECDWQGRREDWDSHACARAGSSKVLLAPLATALAHCLAKEIATEDYTSEAATCTYCHEAMSNQVEHYLQCEAIPTPCPHAIYGCPARLPRPEVAAHLPDCPFEKLKGVFAHFEDRFASLEDENRSLRAQVHSLADRLDLSESVTRNALGAFLDAPEDESLRNQMARLVEGITGLSHTIASLEMKSDMQVRLVLSTRSRLMSCPGRG